MFPIPSVQDIMTLPEDQRLYILCEWAHDFKLHEKQQNGSIQRIEDRINKITYLVIINCILAIMANPSMFHECLSLLKHLFIGG